MIARKNANGLFSIEIDVRGPRKQRTLKGLIDTGSTDCVCLYTVITTLQVRPIDFQMVNTISSRRRLPVYDAHVGFDDKTIRVPLIRVADIADSCDFILGMSVLSQCDMSFGKDEVQITWR